jgi:hypothetical protein
MANGLGIGAVGGFAHFERGVVIAQRTPGIRQCGLELQRAPQTRDGLLAPAQPTQREAFERQRLRLIGQDLQDLARLLERGLRVRLQQARRMSERDLERAGRFCGRSGHGLTNRAYFLFPPPARSLMSRYHISSPS